jgi:hypothetical protein
VRLIYAFWCRTARNMACWRSSFPKYLTELAWRTLCKWTWLSVFPLIGAAHLDLHNETLFPIRRRHETRHLDVKSHTCHLPISCGYPSRWISSQLVRSWFSHPWPESARKTGTISSIRLPGCSLLVEATAGFWLAGLWLVVPGGPSANGKR